MAEKWSTLAAGPLACDAAYGKLTIEGVSLSTPAWCLPDLSALWEPRDFRGSNRLIPGLNGRKPYKRRLDETRLSLPLLVVGFCDQSGTPYDEMGVPFNQGLETNIRYLQEAFGLDDPALLPSGNSTLTAVFTLPSGNTRTGLVQVVGMHGVLRPGLHWKGTLELIDVEAKLIVPGVVGPAPFVPTPYNKAIVSTLAYESPKEPDGSTLFTFGGFRFIACIANDRCVMWQESTAYTGKTTDTFPGTFGRRNVVGTLNNTHAASEGEGMTYGIVGGIPIFMVGDQNNNEAWVFKPNAYATASDLMGAWTRSSVGAADVTPAPIWSGTWPVSNGGVHTVIAHDWDLDGDDEFLFCDETGGQVMLADYDGSGSPLDPTNWTVTQIATANSARTIAQNCPADIMGNGRGDVVIGCRGSVGPQAHILEAPAPGSIASPWTKTSLVGPSYPVGAPWACLFDAEGSGQQLDIATFVGGTSGGFPHYWLHSEGYSTVHYFPNPTMGVGQQPFVIGAVPDPAGGADIIVYSYGDTGSGTLSSMSLFYNDGTGYAERPNATTFNYGHAIESRFTDVAITGLPNRGELLMSDSGGSNGGQRMAQFSFYDDANVQTKATPDVVQSKSNAGTSWPYNVVLDADPTVGRLLIAICTGATSSQAITPPAGWEPVQFYSGDVGFAVYMKISVGSGDTTTAWSGAVMVSIIEVIDADVTRPILASRSRKRPSGGSTAMLNPELTVDQNGTLLIGMWAFSNSQGAGAGVAPTYPSGFTQMTYTNGQRRHATAYKRNSVAGPTGVLNATAAVATNATSLSLAIRGI